MAEETGITGIGHQSVNGVVVAEENPAEDGIVVADGGPIGGGHGDVGGKQECGSVGEARHEVSFPVEGFAGIDAVAEGLQLLQVVDGEGVGRRRHKGTEHHAFDDAVVQNEGHHRDARAGVGHGGGDGVAAARERAQVISENTTALFAGSRFFQLPCQARSGTTVQFHALANIVGILRLCSELHGPTGGLGNGTGPVVIIRPFQTRVAPLLKNPIAAQAGDGAGGAEHLALLQPDIVGTGILVAHKVGVIDHLRAVIAGGAGILNTENATHIVGVGATTGRQTKLRNTGNIRLKRDYIAVVDTIGC